MHETKEAAGGKRLSLWRVIHADEKGAVSLETVLIIAAIALPILIFVIRVGWPKIRDIFNKGLDDLREGGQGAAGAGT